MYVSRTYRKQVNGIALSDIDPRARTLGEQISTHFKEHNDRCLLVTGAGHTGKTQSAMVARSTMDPTGESSIHTSAAIINTNSRMVPTDRSAKWQSWDCLLDFKKDGHAPELVVIDEAGSCAPPDAPVDLCQAFARGLLLDWAQSGTKFVLIGHTANENLVRWAEWLSGDHSHYAAVDTRG